MKAVLTGDPKVATKFAEECREEGSGYYDSECGYSTAVRCGMRNTFGIHLLPCGGVSPENALAILICVAERLRREIPPVYNGLGIRYEDEPVIPELTVQSLFREWKQFPDSFGGWLTSGGNLTVVGGEWEYRDGRRHGLRMCFRDSRDYCYLETQCPEAHPDQCDLEPESV